MSNQQSNRILVLYKSGTGYTKKYAQWLGEDLSADVREFSSITAAELAPYAAVIYGGGLIAGSINGFNKAKKQLLPSGKPLFVFAVGATPTNVIADLDIWKNILPEGEQALIPHFYLHGGLNYNDMKGGHKLMMSMYISMVKGNVKKGKASDYEKGMLDMIDKPVDFTDRSTLAPLENAVRAKLGL